MKQFFLLMAGAGAFVSCGNSDTTKIKTAQAAAMNTDLLQQNLKGGCKKHH